MSASILALKEARARFVVLFTEMSQERCTKVITGSAVALHCVKAHRQSQWRSPNFNPGKIYTP